MSIQYRPEIDGLRAIAVLSVLGFHAFPTMIPGGFVGVDIFFVISGYLITSILLAENQVGALNLKGFYARRIIRIFPALIVVLAACFLTGWYTMIASEFKQLGKHILAGATFYSNFSLWFESGYFDKASELKPLLHLWSLGIEEQFYIVWPLLIMVFARLHIRSRTWIIFFILLSLAWSQYLVVFDRTQAFYSPLARAWELLIGSLLAFDFSGRRSIVQRLQHPTVPWLGLGLLLFSVVCLSSENRFPGAWAMVPAIGSFLLLVPNAESAVLRGFLSHRWLVNIGLISFPLYLWHWPLLSFARIFEGQEPPLAVRIGLLCLAFILATCTYHGIEKSIRKIRPKFAVVLLLLLMVLVALVGKNIYDRDGLDRIRYKKMIALSPELKQDFIEWEHTGLLPNTQCERAFQFPGSSICLSTHPERLPNAALIGDSHAFHGYWGLSQALDAQGENLILLGRGACLPFKGFKRGADADGCQPHMDQTLAWVKDQPSITKVLLMFRGRYLANHSSEAGKTDFRVALEKTIELMQKADKKVYLFSPVSEPGFDPRLCVGSLPLGRKPPDNCDISRSQDLAHRQDLMEIFAQVATKYPSVIVVDPSNYLCEGDVCPLTHNGKSIFKDENHLSYSGSLLLGRRLLESHILN
jgi:peptidoglycan/LPS O-acetylase OafA/YrhL